MNYSTPIKVASVHSVDRSLSTGEEVQECLLQKKLKKGRKEGQLFSPSFSPLLPSIPPSVQYGAFSSLDPLLGEKV